MPFFTPAHLRSALAYLGENAHPQLITLLAMFRAQIPVTMDDDDAKPFGAREENLLLSDYFRPEGGPEERPFYVPFGPGAPSRWRDYRYAGRSLQRMRKDRQNAGIALRQSPNDNKRWAFRPGLTEDLQNHAADMIGHTPLSMPMLAIWLYRSTNVGSLADATDRLRREFHLDEYVTEGRFFSWAIPSELGAVRLQSEPMPPVELLSLLETADTTTSEEPEEAEPTPPIPEEPPGRWDITAAELGTLCGLAGVERTALQALAALRAGMHVIFTGPPGCGKTTLAVCLCRQAGFPWWTVSATDQWTTFDTIGGYFPVVHQDKAGEQLDFLPGHIVDTIERQKCLVIDEINRADIDKAFGEMFTLLSGQAVTLPFRRRAEDGSYRRIRLTQGPTLAEDDLEAIEVPSWWRIIGAMNDADKQSLKQLSYAFMRRFAFVAVSLPPPNAYEKLIRDLATSRGNIPAPVVNAVVALFSSEASGFGQVGILFGPAIPLSMIRHASNRVSLENQIQDQALLRELLESYLAPQLQGRADLHDRILALLEPTLGSETAGFGQRLAVWTGYIKPLSSADE